MSGLLADNRILPNGMWCNGYLNLGQGSQLLGVSQRSTQQRGWRTKTRNERRVYLFDELLAVIREAVVDPFVRKKIIGHTNLETTAIYTHTSDVTLARGMRQAAELRQQSLRLARDRASLPARDDERVRRLA